MIVDKDQAINIGGIEYPFKLLQALEKQKVVFFCGAGISIPFGLPTFEKLAKDILDKKTIEDDIDIPCFLDNSLINVKEKTQDIITKAQGKAEFEQQQNSLHQIILKLQLTPKIITTNFDTIFSEFPIGQELGQHIYEKLPYGDQFSGVVYIHGNVDEPESIIITESDFAQAYVGKGRATDFLKQLFSSDSVVLFIGYSCDDPIMRYIFKAALHQQERCFIVLSYDNREEQKKNREKCQALKLSYIEYDSEEHHKLLRISLGRLCEVINRNHTEENDEIRHILQLDAANQEEQDYVVYKLYTAENIGFETPDIHESWFNIIDEQCIQKNKIFLSQTRANVLYKNLGAFLCNEKALIKTVDFNKWYDRVLTLLAKHPFLRVEEFISAFISSVWEVYNDELITDKELFPILQSFFQYGFYEGSTSRSVPLCSYWILAKILGNFSSTEDQEDSLQSKISIVRLLVSQFINQELLLFPHYNELITQLYDQYKECFIEHCSDIASTYLNTKPRRYYYEGKETIVFCLKLVESKDTDLAKELSKKFKIDPDVNYEKTTNLELQKYLENTNYQNAESISTLIDSLLNIERIELKASLRRFASENPKNSFYILKSLAKLGKEESKQIYKSICFGLCDSKTIEEALWTDILGLFPADNNILPIWEDIIALIHSGKVLLPSNTLEGILSIKRLKRNLQPFA